MFMRGEEILSGAQRIHDPEFLTERALVHEMGGLTSIEMDEISLAQSDSSLWLPAEIII